MRLYLIVTLCMCLLYNTKAEVSEGTLRFYRNGDIDTNQSWQSGIVQIYLSNSWGNICERSFGSNEADVICHQLSFQGANSYSSTSTTSKYGIDNSSTAIENVYCSTSSYRALTQCSFGSSSLLCDDNSDVIVTCYSDRIWDSPTAGDIRLSGGAYSNQGLLEVYCNNEWGTVCDGTFSKTAATVACQQLGYNDYDDFDHLSNKGTSSVKIWLNSLSCSSTSSNCLSSCQSCPITEVNDMCTHSEDITLQCSYDSSESKVYSVTTDICDIDLSGLAAAIIIAFIIGFIVCCGLCILAVTLPFCICCCLGVGIGASMGRSGRPKTTVVTQQYPDQQSYSQGQATAGAGYEKSSAYPQ